MEWAPISSQGDHSQVERQKIYGVSISAKKLVSQFYCVKKSLKTLKFKARAV